MYRIIKKSWIWFSFSILLTILSVLSISLFGLRLGIDFKGGTVIQFKSQNEKKTELAKETLNELGYNGYQIKEGASKEAIIRMETISADSHQKLSQALLTKLGDYSETQYDTVGPTVSKELTSRSAYAVFFASIFIILFIAYSFRKVPRPLSPWKFGVCAVLALIHDLLITTGFVSLLGHFFVWMEVDALFVTALLTIMGFSVHDTIVVYDRLRENFIRNPHESIDTVAEESINQTLVRSINTSMTTVLVLIALLIFGSQSIKHFITTLTFGIIIGTYSSIFNATPLMVLWQKRSLKKI